MNVDVVLTDVSACSLMNSGLSLATSLQYLASWPTADSGGGGDRESGREQVGDSFPVVASPLVCTHVVLFMTDMLW